MAIDETLAPKGRYGLELSDHWCRDGSAKNCDTCPAVMLTGIAELALRQRVVASEGQRSN